MAPQDSENCGRNFAKRKQSDAEFAGNRLLYAWLLLTYIAINTLLGRVTRHPAGMHCPARDDAFVSSFVCFLPVGCREAANCRYCFYSQAKNQVFRPVGGLVAPIQVKLCRTDGHPGPLGCAKFHLNRPRGWECGTKNIKNIHFLVKSRPAGATPLTDYQNL